MVMNQNQILFFQYHGCKWHGCPCRKERNSLEEERRPLGPEPSSERRTKIRQNNRAGKKDEKTRF